MSETKFPEEEDGESFWTCYSPHDVKDWFKRCVAEFPSDWTYDEMKNHPFGYIECIRLWKNAWFSQFIEKGEDEK